MPKLTILARTFFQSVSLLNELGKQRLEHFLTQLQSGSQDDFGIQELSSAGGPGFCLARLSQKHSVVINRDTDHYILSFVGQTDIAEQWAGRHCVQRHPMTGAIQLVPLPEFIDCSASSPPATFLNWGQFDASFLLRLGVPVQWIEHVRGISDEKSFFAVYAQMPEEAAEHLYSLFLGQPVTLPHIVPPPPSPEKHYDNLRRFYVMSDSETVSEVLARPFEQWMLFLHPSQRSLVAQEFNGPCKVTGSAGTGKTVVAIHRAKHLAAAGRRVLLTTFTNRLKDDLERRVEQLCSVEVRSRITIDNVHHFALTCAKQLPAQNVHKIAYEDDVKPILTDVTNAVASSVDLHFLINEWSEIIDNHGVVKWEEYRDATRVGRGTGLSEGRRRELWQVFEPTLNKLKTKQMMTFGALCRNVREALASGDLQQNRFDGVIVDEVQDLNSQAIGMLAALCPPNLAGLMLIGDAGQRIYPSGFSLRGLGIDVRGRSHRLSVNYRMTHETERATRALRPTNVEDLDGGTEQPWAVQNILHGPKPILAGFDTYAEENNFLVNNIERFLSGGVKPAEIGIFARTKKICFKIHEALTAAGIPVQSLKGGAADNTISLLTLHSAKGLEFRYVFVCACRDNAIPSPVAMKSATKEGLDNILEQERTLLYVAMTRARDQVWVTWSHKKSRFLDTVEEHAEVL